MPSGLDELSLRHIEGSSGNSFADVSLAARAGYGHHARDDAPALTPDTDSEVAEALLRYFVRRREPSEINRDKTDLISTFLYRHPRVQDNGSSMAMDWTDRCRFLHLKSPLSKFLPIPTCLRFPEEHVQLLRNFDPLREEIARYRDFNHLSIPGLFRECAN